MLRKVPRCRFSLPFSFAAVFLAAVCRRFFAFGGALFSSMELWDRMKVWRTCNYVNYRDTFFFFFARRVGKGNQKSPSKLEVCKLCLLNCARISYIILWISKMLRNESLLAKICVDTAESVLYRNPSGRNEKLCGLARRGRFPLPVVPERSLLSAS